MSSATRSNEDFSHCTPFQCCVSALHASPSSCLTLMTSVFLNMGFAGKNSIKNARSLIHIPVTASPLRWNDRHSSCVPGGTGCAACRSPAKARPTLTARMNKRGLPHGWHWWPQKMVPDEKESRQNLWHCAIGAGQQFDSQITVLSLWGACSTRPEHAPSASTNTFSSSIRQLRQTNRVDTTPED